MLSWIQKKIKKKSKQITVEDRISQILYTVQNLSSLKKLIESESISSYSILSFTKLDNCLYTIILNENISLNEKSQIFHFLFKSSNSSFNDFIIKEYKSRYILNKIGDFKSFLTLKYFIPCFNILFQEKDMLSIPHPIANDFEKFQDIFLIESLDLISIKIFGNKSKKNKKIILQDIFKTGRYYLFPNILIIKNMFKDQQFYETILLNMIENHISLDNLQLKFPYENYDKFTNSIKIFKSINDKSNFNFFIKDEQLKIKTKSYLIFDTISMMEELTLSNIEYYPNEFKNIKNFHDDLVVKINQLNQILIKIDYDFKAIKLHNKEIHHLSDTYKIELPMTNRELQSIGNKLRNCVGSYHYTVKIQKQEAILLIIYKNNMLYGLVEYLISNAIVGQAVLYANQPMPQNILKIIQYEVQNKLL